MHSYAPSPHNAAKGGNFSWAFGGDTSFSESQYHRDQELNSGATGQAGAQHSFPSGSWRSPLPSECGSPRTDDTSAFARYQQGVPPPRTKRAQVKNACTNCQQACKKCSNRRPCERCTRYELKDCVNSTRKPRAKGFKRGPYKKRTNPQTNVGTGPQMPYNGYISKPIQQLAYAAEVTTKTPPKPNHLLRHMFHVAQPFDIETLPSLTPLRATTPTADFSFGQVPQLTEQQGSWTPPNASQFDFSLHAEQLRVSLDNAGLVSCPPSPRGDKRMAMTPMIPFMGHAASAPSSPTGLRAFMELDDDL